MDVALESFRRVRSKDFASRFYACFLQADPGIQALFQKSDLERQKHMLTHGIQMLLEYGLGRPIGVMAIERLGRRHGSELKVDSTMYEAWQRCLFRTLAALDEQWSPSVERAWRKAMAPGLAVMQQLATSAG